VWLFQQPVIDRWIKSSTSRLLATRWSTLRLEPDPASACREFVGCLAAPFSLQPSGARIGMQTH